MHETCLSGVPIPKALVIMVDGDLDAVDQFVKSVGSLIDDISSSLIDTISSVRDLF